MKISIKAATFVLGAMIAIPSFAAPMSTIVLGINGDASVGANYISFGQYPSGTNYQPAPGFGTFQASLVQPGTIIANAGITPGGTGTIQSLSSALEPTNTTFATPVDFLNFDQNANLSLYLTYLYQGTAGPNSPFTLTNTSTGANATFDVLGYVWQNGTKTPYTGIFSATFAGMTVAQLEANLPQNTPFSATFAITPTPEPASLLLMGIGLLGAGVVARKKIKS